MNIDKYSQYLEKIEKSFSLLEKKAKKAKTTKEKVHCIVDVDKLVVRAKKFIDRMNRIEEFHCNQTMQEGLRALDKFINEFEEINKKFWLSMERVTR